MKVEERTHLVNQSSMLYWWPQIEEFNIPMPRTEILPFPSPGWASNIMFTDPSDYTEHQRRELYIFEQQLKATAPLVQRHPEDPVFIRTDQCSAKHQWRHTCFVEDISHINGNFWRLIEENELVGWMDFVPRALVIREYIPMQSAFVAFFGHMPINKERRYFVKDGEVLCHHPYWPEDAIRPPFRGILPVDWKDKLRSLNEETNEEIDLLMNHAITVSELIDGYWSVDFSKGRDGKWYLIDMGRGEISYHDLSYHDIIS